MRYLKLLVVFALFCIFTNISVAQTASGLTVGIGRSFIDNDGNPREHFDFRNWGSNLFPGKIAIEKGVTKFFNIEATLATTRFASGQIVESRVVANPYYMNTADLNVKFMLSSIYGQIKLFDLYLLGGAGINSSTSGNSTLASTYNYGFGFNTWVAKRWGINFQTVAKKKISLVNSPNYIQHSIGVVYSITLPKGSNIQNTSSLKHLRKIIKNN